MICLLDKAIGFPDPKQGDEDGLFAVGGDLSPERLLLAYSYGIFPWFPFRPEDACDALIDKETGKPYIQWWCPMQRFVIFPNEIHISHSMKQEIKKVLKGEIHITKNTAFKKVMDNCGKMSCGQDRLALEGAWLSDDIKKAYTKLHEMGYALSVEVWDKENNLIGGLYGVTLGYGFYGESMFSLKPNASKIALIFLAGYLDEQGCALIDCQFETAHLKRMGGKYISYDEYLKLIHGNDEDEDNETK